MNLQFIPIRNLKILRRQQSQLLNLTLPLNHVMLIVKTITISNENIRFILFYQIKKNNEMLIINYLRYFRHYQYKVKRSHPVSSVLQESKLSAALTEKQLALALKKLENYSKLNKILTQKLDATSVNAEISNYK